MMSNHVNTEAASDGGGGETGSTPRGARSTIRRAGVRCGIALALFLSGVPATAAAQSGGGGGISGPNPVIEFLNAVVPEILPPLMVACGVVSVGAWLLSGMVTKPETTNRLKELRNGSAIALFGAPLLAAFFDYIAPAIPFGFAQGLDLVPVV